MLFRSQSNALVGRVAALGSLGRCTHMTRFLIRYWPLLVAVTCAHAFAVSLVGSLASFVQIEFGRAVDETRMAWVVATVLSGSSAFVFAAVFFYLRSRSSHEHVTHTNGLTMRYNEPGHRVTVAIQRPRGPGR